MVNFLKSKKDPKEKLANVVLLQGQIYSVFDQVYWVSVALLTRCPIARHRTVSARHHTISARHHTLLVYEGN